MGKLSQIFTKTPRYQTIPPFDESSPEKLHKIPPYTQTRMIYIIATDKNLRQARLEELHVTHNQRGYLRTLIIKGFELTKKKYH